MVRQDVQARPSSHELAIFWVGHAVHSNPAKGEVIGDLEIVILSFALCKILVIAHMAYKAMALQH